MKLPEHLEKRRDELNQKRNSQVGLYEKSIFHLSFEQGYNAAVADMLKEVEPLVDAIANSLTVQHKGNSHALLKNAIQDWQAKFGKGDE